MKHENSAAPLLVVDGDSFAHRAFHALPRSIRRAGGLPGNALVGFANMLLGLWTAEQPRAVLAEVIEVDGRVGFLVRRFGVQRVDGRDDPGGEVGGAGEADVHDMVAAVL